MFEQILKYFNHPLLQEPFIRLGVIIAVFAVLGIIVSYLLRTVVKKFTEKTKTEADDKILARIKNPIVYIIILMGIHIGLLSFGLESSLMETLSSVCVTLYILIGTYIIASIADIVIAIWGTEWTKKTDDSFDDTILPLIHKASSIIFAVIGFTMIMSHWGIDVTGIVAGLGVAGIAIGFAVKDSLANIFGGLSIILDREYHVGDVIQLKNGTMGTVLDIGLRSTRIKTFDNELVIIPNGQIANTEVWNRKLPDLSIRAKINFGVEYGVEIENVKSIVIKAIEGIEDIERTEDRSPNVVFKNMGSSALEFTLYFWLNDYSKKFKTKELANIAIYNALNKAGIVIPYQTFTVFNKKE